VNVFSRVRESGLREEHAAMRVARGTPWLLVRCDMSK
jgi:hypothetical protein